MPSTTAQEREPGATAVFRPIQAADYLSITLAASRKGPLLTLYHECHEILKSVMPAQNCFVALEEGSDYLGFPYYVDEKDSENSLKRYPREGMTAWCIDRGTTVHISAEDERLKDIQVIGTIPDDWLGVTLIDREGNAFGALVVQTYTTGMRYSDEQVAFLEFVARQISIAIQFRVIDRETAIRRIAALVEETTYLDDLYSGIHRIIADLVPAAAKSFIIARIDHDLELFKPVYWCDENEDFDSLVWRADQGLSGYVCSGEGRSFIWEKDVTQDPPGFSLLGVKPTFWIGAPLRNEDAIIGIVIVQSYSSGIPLTTEDEHLISGISEPVGHAIARTELLRRTYPSRILRY